MIQPQTPSEYLHNKNMRETTLFSYCPILGGRYISNGVEYSKEEFYALYPLCSSIQLPNRRWKGENISPNQKLVQ